MLCAARFFALCDVLAVMAGLQAFLYIVIV